MVLTRSLCDLTIKGYDLICSVLGLTEHPVNTDYRTQSFPDMISCEPKFQPGMATLCTVGKGLDNCNLWPVWPPQTCQALAASAWG
jgi:hypothetical protein